MDEMDAFYPLNFNKGIWKKWMKKLKEYYP